MQDDFETFVASLIGLSGFEALDRTDREGERVDRAGRKLWVSAARREALGEYRRQLGGLKMFLFYKERPDGLSTNEFLVIRTLAQDLVGRGILEADMLSLFDTE